MMSYGADPSLPPAYAQPPQKSWLGRNWLWFVPVVVLLPVCACGGICGGSFLFIMQTMKNSGAYKLALETTQENPAVKAALGEPVEETWMTFGAVSTNTATGGEANLVFRVQGPDGAAMVECEARQPVGSDQWELIKLIVRPENGGGPIVIVGEEGADWEMDDAQLVPIEMDEPAMDEPEMPAEEEPADDLGAEESESESPGAAAVEEADRLREEQPEN